MVEIHRELHAVEDVDVETEVLVDGFLPFEIRVAELFEDRAGPEEILVGGVVDVGSRSRVGVEILVSGVTDRETQLQQVKPFGLAPRLVVDVPSHAHGPRRREEVLRTENRRSVHTQAGVEQITVAVGVVAVEIEARAAADPVRVARLVALLETFGERGILVQVARESEDLVAGVLLRARTEIPAADGIDLMMAEKPAVGDGDIAVVAHQVGLFRRVGALGGRTVEIGVRGRLERLALGDALIQGETPADLQRGHGTPDDREIVAQSEVLRHVGVDHAAELVERVVDELLRHGIRLQKLRNLPVLAVFAVIGIGLGESREGDRLALALHGIETEIVRKDQLVGTVDEPVIPFSEPFMMPF